jgi:hypothetical protein
MKGEQATSGTPSMPAGAECNKLTFFGAASCPYHTQTSQSVIKANSNQSNFSYRQYYNTQYTGKLPFGMKRAGLVREPDRADCKHNNRQMSLIGESFMLLAIGRNSNCITWYHHPNFRVLLDNCSEAHPINSL